METPVKVNVSQEEMKKLELVEVIVETEAEAGVSGINVAGGGKEGIFVKDVLRDSPAAKALSLQEGDQLLSARVYFDNVKYEDALKILQCAEPYKVSFCLKRTVPGTDVTVSPDLASFDIKGPKAKMPKMSVKSIMPVKKKKKAKASAKVSGEAALQRPDDVTVEVTPGKGELSPVDVEFALPKFSKFRKAKGTYGAGGAVTSPEVSVSLPAKERRKKRLKFPRLRVKDAAATKDVSLEIEPPKGTVKVKTPQGKVEGPEVEAKAKVKTPKFGIPFPKTKKPKVDVSLPKVKADVKVPEAKAEIKVPEIKEEAKFKPPKVELDISLPTGKSDVTVSKPELETKGIGAGVKGDIEAPDVHAKEGFKIKMPKIGILTESSDVEVKGSLPAAKGEFELEGPESKLKMPTIKVPKVGISLPKGKVEGELDVHPPDADLEAKGPGGKLRTGMKLPSVEIAAPKIDMDISLPKARAEGDVEAPDISKTGEGFKFKMPKIGISTKLSDDVDSKGSMPEAKGGIELEGPEGKLQMPKIKVPKFGAFLSKGEGEISIPEAELEAQGKKVGIRVPSLEITAPKVDFDIALPKGKPEAEMDVGSRWSEGSLEGADIKLKMPKVELPKFGGKAKDVEVDVTIEPPKVEGGIKAPESRKAEIEGPDIKVKGPKFKLPTFGISAFKEKGEDLSVPEAEVKGPEGPEAKMKLPSVKMPSFDISLPKVPGVDLHLPKADISLPSFEGEVKTHDVETGSKVSVEGPDAKYKLPKISLPTFGLSAKGKEPELDIHGVDIEGSEAKGPKITLPKVDLSLPKIKPVETDVSPPEIEVSVKKPKPDAKLSQMKVDIKGPEVESEGSESRLSLPSIKMPTFDITMPKVDLDIGLPKAKADVSEPSLEGGFKVPEQPAEGSFEGYDIKLKMPKVELPKFGLKSKEIDTELDVPAAKVKGDIKLPHVKADIQETDIDLPDAKGAKISMPKFGMSFGKKKQAEVDGQADFEADVKVPKAKVEIEKPAMEGSGAKIQLPSVKLPKFDVSMPKLPDVDIDVALPKGAAEKSLELTDVGIDTKSPEISIEGPDAKGKMPKFSFPKFGISGSKSKKAEMEIKSPDAEVDFESPDTKVKGSKIKMPKFGITFPKSKLEGSVDVSGPSLEGDLKTSKPKVDIEQPTLEVESSEAKFKLPTVKLPKVDISAPKVDMDISLPKIKSGASADMDAKADTDKEPSEISVECPDLKVKMPRFTMPKFGSKGKGVDVEIEGGVPKAEAKIALPEIEGDVKGKVKGPSGDADIDISGDKVKGKEGKMKMPKFKMPTFGISKKDAEAKITVPDIDVKLPKGKVEVKGPEVDTESLEGKVKTPFIKMPKFAMSTPKGKAPEGEVKFDAEAKGTKVKGDIQVPDVDIKMPKITVPKFGSKEGKLDAGLEAEGEVEGPEGKLKSGKIKMPSIELSLPSGRPEGEVLLPKAEVDVSEADIKGYEGDLKIPKMPVIDISAPKIEIDFGLPKPKGDAALQIEGDSKFYDRSSEGSELQLKFPKFTMPKFGVSGSKEKLDAGIKTPVIDISASKPTAEIEAPEFEIDSSEGRIKGPKLKVPKVDISLPKIKTTDADVSLTGGEFSIEGPKLKDDTEGKFKLPSVELPTFSTPKAPEVDLDISLTKGKDADVKLPKMEGTGYEIDTGAGGSDFKIKMPKIRMPKFGAGAEADASLPMVDVDKSQKVKIGVDSPKIGDIDVSGDKVKGPKVKLPKFTIGLPKEADAKVEVDIKKPELEDDGHGDKLKFKVPKIGFSPGKTKLEGEAPELKAEAEVHPPEDTDYKFRMPKITVPDIGFSVSKEESIDGNIDITLPKVAFGVPKPKIDLKGKGPEVEIHKSASIDAPGVEVEIPEAKKKMPKIKMPTFGLTTSKEDLSGKGQFEPLAEDAEGKIKKPLFKMPDVELSTPKIKTQAETDVNGIDLDVSLPEHKDTSQGISIKMPKVTMPSFGFSKDKERILSADVSGPAVEVDVKAKRPDVKTPDVHIEIPDAEKKFKVKLPKVGIALPKGEEELDILSLEPKAEIKGADIRGKGEVKGVRIHTKPEVDGETEGQEGKLKMPKVKKAVFVLVKPKDDSAGLPESDVHTKTGKKQISVESPELEVQGKEAKIKMPRIKMKPTFGISHPKSKGGEVNGEVDASTPKKDHEIEVSSESKLKTSKLKLPKVALSSGKSGSLDISVNGTGQVNGRSETFQNGSPESRINLGKIKLPKVELSSPYAKGKESDAELSSKLVKTEEPSSKDGTDLSASPLKGSKFKINFPGFKKKADTSLEGSESPTVVTSTARTEMASLEKKGKGDVSAKTKVGAGFTSSKSKGEYIVDNSGFSLHTESRGEPTLKGVHGVDTSETGNGETESKQKSAKFRFPKFSLSPKSRGMLEISSEQPTYEGSDSLQETGGKESSSGFKIRMPRIGFKSYEEEHTSEEQILQEEGGNIVIVSTSKQIKTESVAEKSTTI
ncbi:neuroblast differentiation-associated protein AHNAK [Latimeria chalumnae]|uniref:neuroblast differentiation-associated protein AHNAK n=1 Tax=Latimeria chalumnae TaxID=7897 RepID=UPI0003C19D3A|nr:PREDICTED: periaxin [Latimeria chalumnae]|eukprot:XP_005991678.1 PREDICTED: periaxin [Latimeria chalumnae]